MIIINLTYIYKLIYGGVGVFFSRQDDRPVLLMGKGLLPPRKAKHGVGSYWGKSFK
jgi:hypothetical protein